MLDDVIQADVSRMCQLDVKKRPRWPMKKRTRWLKKRARLQRESGFNVGNDGKRVGK